MINKSSRKRNNKSSRKRNNKSSRKRNNKSSRKRNKSIRKRNKSSRKRNKSIRKRNNKQSRLNHGGGLTQKGEMKTNPQKQSTSVNDGNDNNKTWVVYLNQGTDDEFPRHWLGTLELYLRLQHRKDEQKLKKLKQWIDPTNETLFLLYKEVVIGDNIHKVDADAKETDDSTVEIVSGTWVNIDTGEELVPIELEQYYDVRFLPEEIYKIFLNEGNKPDLMKAVKYMDNKQSQTEEVEDETEMDVNEEEEEEDEEEEDEEEEDEEEEDEDENEVDNIMKLIKKQGDAEDEAETNYAANIAAMFNESEQILKEFNQDPFFTPRGTAAFNLFWTSEGRKFVESNKLSDSDVKNIREALINSNLQENQFYYVFDLPDEKLKEMIENPKIKRNISFINQGSVGMKPGVLPIDKDTKREYIVTTAQDNSTDKAGKEHGDNPVKHKKEKPSSRPPINSDLFEKLNKASEKRLEKAQTISAAV